ncbi:hypothetical protein HNP84_002727 [Thermocatellispora tengchongensis]|uniref:Uncharacterized protein n=1 Tax=Thermocatellispora tengchongensis TaxID=1073253 RepID=A0A840P3D0_9ACTN|nr:hypothetical protein [Thermocatellispora tengchongensis]MBB5133006.1 hypothetical protein [Thermocatellispora tengchongensis]
MARTSRWRSVVGVLALSGGAFFATGSAAFADPDPAADDVTLRLVVDECEYLSGAVAP